MNLIDVPLAKYAVLVPLINALSTFSLFNEDRCHLSTATLPFFENYQLLQAQTFTTIPPVTMHYLWNPENNHIIKMDGTRDAVFDNLDKLRLVLTSATVVPYVTFVLGQVQSEEGTLRLVESACCIDYAQQPTYTEREFLKEHIKPASFTAEAEGFYITCQMIYGDTLFNANIRLEQNGLFDFIGEEQVGEPMPCLRQLFLE